MMLNRDIPIHSVPMGNYRIGSWGNIGNYEDVMSVEDAINKLVDSINVKNFLILFSYYNKDLRYANLDLFQFNTETSLGVDELYMYTAKVFIPYICDVINMVKQLSFYYKQYDNRLSSTGVIINKRYSDDTPAYLFSKKLIEKYKEDERFKQYKELDEIIDDLCHSVYDTYMLMRPICKEQMILFIEVLLNKLNIKADGKKVSYTKYEIGYYIERLVPRYYFFNNMTPVEAMNLENASIFFYKFAYAMLPKDKYNKNDLNDFIISSEILYDYRHMLYEVFDEKFFERNSRHISSDLEQDKLKMESLDTIILSFLYRPIGPKFSHRYARKLCVLHNVINNVFNYDEKTPSIGYIDNIITYIPPEDDKRKNNSNNLEVLNLCKGARQGWDKKYGEPIGSDEDLILPF